ncbi:MAG: glycerophosphodiester phosphodiesterase family protein, partial [Paracoccaceae bacterium]|nr:glycerophosphodiester phosphodiesterase family protein [Paracoccaceae bacterium]
LAAIKAGYGIECDLQLSADGIPMVFHDDTLDRLTAQTGPLSALTAAELGRIALNDSAETIPTLAEILTLVGGRSPLLIEIKDQHGAMGLTDERLEQATASALAGYKGPVALMSFNPHSVAAMARLAPDLPRGLTTCAYDLQTWFPLPTDLCDHLRAIADYDRINASFVSHEWADLARPRIADLRAQGAAILCWTIRSAAAEATARQLADNITFEGYAAPIPS